MTEEKIEGWLTETYDYERPRRGQVREGVIVKVDDRGISVDVGLKRDGFVPETDIERLDEEDLADLKPGQEVEARVLKPVDREGRIVLSLWQARLRKDWAKAQEMLEEDEIWRGEVVDYNKGGLIVQFKRLRGFVPGSHLWSSGKRHSSPEKRKQLFKEYVGEELPLQVIEVDRDRRRLILSERLARQEMRKHEKERLLEDLMEGEVVEGTVRSLADFGAFVDLGGADGLIHISELAWQYVDHPREVLKVGEKVKVYILRLDHKRQRIALSLKRLQPYPWDEVEASYHEGQIISGKVTGLTDFGAFVALDAGVEGLVHISELSDPPPDHPRDVVRSGDELIVRILSIDTYRHRIGLSLKQVSEADRKMFLAEQSLEESTESMEVDEPVEAVASDEAVAAEESVEAVASDEAVAAEESVEAVASDEAVAAEESVEAVASDEAVAAEESVEAVASDQAAEMEVSVEPEEAAEAPEGVEVSEEEMALAMSSSSDNGTTVEEFSDEVDEEQPQRTDVREPEIVGQS